MTTNEKLTRFRKSGEKIVEMVKGSELPSVQGTQYYEEYLVLRERVPRRTDRPSVRELGTNGNHATIVQLYNNGSSDSQINPGLNG